MTVCDGIGLAAGSQRRITHAITEITTLKINIVVIGKKNLNPGRPITMSPGKRNKPILFNHGQSNPAITSTAPNPVSAAGPYSLRGN